MPSNPLAPPTAANQMPGYPSAANALDPLSGISNMFGGGGSPISGLGNLFGGGIGGMLGSGGGTSAVSGGPGNLTGTTLNSSGIGGVLNAGGIGNAFFGSKPATPDPGNTAATAIGSDIGNLGQINTLTLGTDATSAQGAALPYYMNLPNYGQNLSTASGNVTQELQGQLPKDVQNQIDQAAAARGIQTGQGAGSPNTGAADLAALGLNSLNMQNLGMQGFGQLVQQTPTGAQFNPASMYVTPEQQQQAQLYANQIAAAPDPTASGLLNTATSVIGGLGGLF